MTSNPVLRVASIEEAERYLPLVCPICRGVGRDIVVQADADVGPCATCQGSGHAQIETYPDPSGYGTAVRVVPPVLSVVPADELPPNPSAVSDEQ